MKFKQKSLITLALASLLSACGGGDQEFGFSGQEVTTNNEVSGGAGEDVSLTLGKGVGTSFESGKLITPDLGYTAGSAGSVSVNIVNSATNTLYTASDVTVTFSSTCATAGTANITSSVTTSTGTASASYTALAGCKTTDTLSASINSGANATNSVIIEPSLVLGTGSGDTFSAGALKIATTSLSAGGTTSISVNVVDSSDKSLYSAKPKSVTFTSTCAGLAKPTATIDTPVSSVNGVATATYESLECEGNDTVVASLENGSTATGNVTIASPELGSIAFVSATPTEISLKEVGSQTRPEASSLSFQVLDKNDNPLENTAVTFELSSTLGGISLSQASAVTNAGGIAKTILKAGTVNTTVRVIARVTASNGQIIETTSSPIAVNSGLPDEDSFSLSIETFNPRGFDFDGTSVSINIRAADVFNNLVPDGTNVAFVTTGGSIEGACTTSSGVCSVKWVSQSPRPKNIGNGLNDGVITILARSTGVEAFTDANGNGVYDVGEAIKLPDDTRLRSTALLPPAKHL